MDRLTQNQTIRVRTWVSQLEFYYKVDRLLTAQATQQSVTTARWDTNKTTLSYAWFTKRVELSHWFTSKVELLTSYKSIKNP